MPLWQAAFYSRLAACSACSAIEGGLPLALAFAGLGSGGGYSISGCFGCLPLCGEASAACLAAALALPARRRLPHGLRRPARRLCLLRLSMSVRPRRRLRLLLLPVTASAVACYGLFASAACLAVAVSLGNNETVTINRIAHKQENTSRRQEGGLFRLRRRLCLFS